MATEFRDPSQFYTPRQEPERSQTIDPRQSIRASLESIPSLQNIGAPRGGIDQLRTPDYQANTTIGRALEGAAKVGNLAINVADDVTKIQINREVRDTLGAIQDNYTSQALAKLGETGPLDITAASEEGVPTAVNKLGARLAGLKAGAEAGSITDRHFYNEANNAIKRVKAQYPGYVDYIDQVQTQTLGTKSANALRREAMNDLEKLQAKTASSMDAQTRFLLQNNQDLPPDYMDRLEGNSDKPPYTYQEAVKYITNKQRQRVDITDDKAKLELMTARGEDPKGKAYEIATRELELATTSFLNTSMVKGLDKLITQYQLTGAKGLDPEKSPEIVGQLDALERQLKAEYRSILNHSSTSPENPAGMRSYRQIIQDEVKINQLINTAMGPWKDIREGFIKGDTSVMQMHAMTAKAYEDKAARDVLSSNKAIPLISDFAKRVGPQAYQHLMMAPGSQLLEANVNAINGLLTAQGLSGQGGDMNEAGAQMRKAGTNTAPAMRDLIDRFGNAIDGPAAKATPLAERINGANKLYNQGTEKFINQFPASQRETLFNILFNEQRTTAMQELKATGAPGANEAFAHYSRESKVAFAQVFQQGLNSIQSANVDRKYIKIDYEPKWNSFVVNKTPEGIKYEESKKTRGLGGFADRFRDIESYLGNRINEPIQKVNRALAKIVPIMEAEGLPKEQAIKIILDQMGFNKDTTKGNTVWQMMLEAVEKLEENVNKTAGSK